jgi:hypothetical protein
MNFFLPNIDATWLSNVPKFHIDLRNTHSRCCTPDYAFVSININEIVHAYSIENNACYFQMVCIGEVYK